MRAGRRLGPVLAALATLCAPEGRAARPAVRLHLDDCIPAQPTVRHLFAIEIDVQLVGAGVPGAADVWALCAEQGRGPVELRVDDPLTGKSLQRSVDLLGAPPRARPRLLALALAELLFASWTELEMQPEPRQDPTSPAGDGAAAALRPAPPPAAPPATAAAARRAARAAVQRRLPGLAPPTGLRLTARAAAQIFPRGGVVLGGAALQVGGDHGAQLGWSCDAAYLYGQQGGDLGTLSAETLSGGLALFFQRQSARRHLGIRAGGGIRAGATRLRGVPASGARAEGATLWGAFVGPIGALSGSLTLPRRLVIELALEGGYLLTPAHGLIDGARALSLEGPFLGLQLGIGVIP